MKKNYKSTIYGVTLVLAVLISNSIYAGNVLIYGPRLTSTPNEQSLATAAGHSVTVVSASQWTSMTASQFTAYDAIIIPDNGCNGSSGNSDGDLTTINNNKSTWSPAIDGRIVLIGGDLMLHREGQYQQITTNSINFVANGSGTGLLFIASCTYYGNYSNVPLTFLSSVVSVNSIGSNCAGSNTIADASHPVMSGITTSGLGGTCVSHNQFGGYPSTLVSVATAGGNPFILASSGCSSTITSISASASPVYNGGVNTNLYIGYPSNTPSVQLTADGATSATWSPATYLSCSTCTTTVFSPTVAGSYTLTATCGGSSQSVTICVKDVRVPNTSGSRAKVYLCHKEPVANRSQTLAVLNRGIAAHMQHHSGDMLGNCNNTCSSNKRDMEFLDLVIDEIDLEVTCTPNPFRQSFKLDYHSISDEDATIAIYGMTGNLVENVSLNGFTNEIELGINLPNGIYTVSFLQGDKTRFFRMIKVD